MKQSVFLIDLLLVCLTLESAGYAYDKDVIVDSTKIYQNSDFYSPVRIDEKMLIQKDEVKNVILFIGDGMGVAHVFAGMSANHGNLNLEYLKYSGFSKTQSFDCYITDSAAGATAIATGVKTYNGAIGVNSDTIDVPTLLELAEAKGLSTGLIATCAITHATPASFIAHQKSRNMVESIAGDYLNTDVDVVIGGGWKHFANRSDGLSLIPGLQKRGYSIVTDQDQLPQTECQKLFALVSKDHLPRASERKDFLVHATEKALDILSQNKKGFFLMVEGSQIDWGGHQNDTGYIVEEMLDMDRAIGAALEFAVKDGQTLIICTADHETGGLALESGDISAGLIQSDYTTDNHTGIMVPVFSIGPGADRFIGIYENTALFEKMKSLLKL